ncbi:zinc finger protein OZF-like, partial [Aphis craccivora]
INDHLLNQPSDIVIKQEYIPTADDYNDYHSSQIRYHVLNSFTFAVRNCMVTPSFQNAESIYFTGCETIKKMSINGTEIKIERNYIDGFMFESVVLQSDSNIISINSTKCGICNKTLTRSRYLKIHMRIHSPYWRKNF